MCSWSLLCEVRGLGILTKASAFRLSFKSIGSHLYHRKMSNTKPNVVFVLGGPGAGKGTQCDKIVEKFKYVHLSAGDLLRGERSREGSEFKELIEDHIKQGKIVPVEITCKLLENAMLSNGGKRFLIDGFPRNKDNLEGWTKTMADKVNLRFVLFFDCSDEICKERCLGRGQAGSGRTDDNEESLKKRIVTYVNETMPIIKHYEEQDLVRTVDASRPPEEVFCDVSNLFEPLESIIGDAN